MTGMTLDKLPKKVLANLDLQMAFMASQCVLAAERLKLFRKLQGKKLTAAAISKKVGIHENYLIPYLNSLMALGLLRKKDKSYFNSSLAKKYYIKERSVYWTEFFSEACIKEYEAFSVLEEMLKTGKNYEDILGIKRKYYVQSMMEDPVKAQQFTYMLYYDHLPDAKALAKNLDLKNYHKVLDVGGGSGVMSIELVKKYRHLKACVFDLEAVINVTRKIIRKEKLSKRVSTIAGDLHKDIPEGSDVIMFCDSYFNNEVLETVYKRLPDRGLIALVDKFSSDNFTEPLFRVMWQLRSKSFWLTSRNQAANMLRATGFKSVKKKRISEDLWMITGIKK